MDIAESASLLRGESPSNMTIRMGIKTLLLSEHVLQIERSGIGRISSEMYIHNMCFERH